MVNITHFTFPSADGCTQLHGMEWIDDSREPIAVLQITHGVSEYIQRYDGFARYLASHGFAVVGHDHLGHGRSANTLGISIYFCDENGWDTAVDDVRGLQLLMKVKYPLLPYFLLGHSMGSFIVRTFLIRYAGAVDGAIVMGSGWQGAAMLAGGQLIAALAAKRYGRRTISRFVNDLAFGGYNKAFAPNSTDFDWIAADRTAVNRYLMDPLCGQTVTIGLFQDMLGGIRFNQTVENLKKMDINTPILFISGQDDPVGDMGKGVARSRDAFTAVGVKDTSLLLYPGLRHEILNEPSAPTQIYPDILQWLQNHL